MSTGRTYQNPVWPRSFPDPFVLKFRGEYWGYCTGFWDDGRCFGILHSRDLVHWEPRAGALEPLPGDHPCYWAPEVTYDNGLFYLYYSVGNEERMEIRVAVADRPEGPFADSGRRLTSEPFAIDAHVFIASDGSRWLFYATDFLEHSHIGTGTVRDRMLDPFTLAGDPRPVSLPRRDWHVYHPNRPEKGGVRWHTVEGPFVLERKGLLYQMFSGGNWQNPTYGVSYAVSPSVAAPGEWEQAADGERVLPVLRTVSGVIGPGHNSVIRGPDNRELWCVYHRWSADSSARVLSIDPLDWAGERLLVLGPSTTPQPAPQPPVFTDFFEDPGLQGWEAHGGAWSAKDGKARGTGAISRWTNTPSFLVEVTARSTGGAFGLGLRGRGGRWHRFLASDPTAFHLLRLEVDGLRVRFEIDGAARWQGRLEQPADEISLVTERTEAEFSGFALTAGWEDLFDDKASPAERGWDTANGEAWVGEGRLWLASGLITKGPAFESYLVTVNARVHEGDGGYVLFPAWGEMGPGPAVELAPPHSVSTPEAGERGKEHQFPLPPGFDPRIDQQLRFRKYGGEIEISWEGLVLGTVAAPTGPTRLGLGARGARVSFEAVRVTALTDD